MAELVPNEGNKVNGELTKMPVMLPKSLLRSKATGSGAARWLNCAASVAMEQALTEGPKKYAEAGTLAHKIAAEAITKETPLDKIEGPDSDTVEAIQVYVGMVRDVAGPGPIIVEERLPLLGSSGGIDAYAIRGKIAFLFDLKYGVGIRISADENEQLAFYATAIREKHPEVKTVQCYLIQPRVEGVFEDTASITSWTIGWQTLAMWRRRFEAGLAEVEKAQGLKAGDHCQFCKAKGGCPAYVGYAEATLAEQQGFPSEMIPAPGERWIPSAVPKVAKMLMAQEVVKSWFAKAEEFLLMVAQSGAEGKKLVEQAGYELTTTKGRRKWAHAMEDDDLFNDDPPTEAKTAAILIELGIPDPYEKKLMPLTRAEKLVSVGDLVVKAPGRAVVKPIEKGKTRKTLPQQTT